MARRRSERPFLEMAFFSASAKKSLDIFRDAETFFRDVFVETITRYF